MIAFLKRLSAPMRSRKAQLGLAIRVTVAAFGALAIATAFNLMLPLWAVLTTAYLVIAMPWEEQSLERAYGQRYASYKRRVRWRIVPYVY